MTPIDWKLLKTSLAFRLFVFDRHHSLVTPIDWKRGVDAFASFPSFLGHHSLVTPIDWKLAVAMVSGWRG